MAEWLKAADCKSAGQRPTEVRTLLSPPTKPETRNQKPEGRPLLVSSFRFLVSKSGSNSVGRVTAFQAVGRGFESRLPLQSRKAESRRQKEAARERASRSKASKGLDDKANGGEHFCL